MAELLQWHGWTTYINSPLHPVVRRNPFLRTPRSHHRSRRRHSGFPERHYYTCLQQYDASQRGWIRQYYTSHLIYKLLDNTHGVCRHWSTNGSARCAQRTAEIARAVAMEVKNPTMGAVTGQARAAPDAPMMHGAAIVSLHIKPLSSIAPPQQEA